MPQKPVTAPMLQTYLTSRLNERVKGVKGVVLLPILLRFLPLLIQILLEVFVVVPKDVPDAPAGPVDDSDLFA